MGEQLRAVEIRKAADADKGAVWDIIRAVLSSDDTYVFSSDSTEAEMLDYWFAPGKYNYVAVVAGKVVGTFWIRANYPGLGSHVANVAYMVSPEARGTRVGRTMAEYSIDEARRLGFRAMQFNFVVKTNTVAVNLWKSVGFDVIGKIPEAFDHHREGLTNAYIMHRKL